MQRDPVARHDLRKMLDRVRRIAHDVVAPAASAVDEEAVWPEAGMRALLDAGLGGLVIPEENGGLGQGITGLVQVSEELGRACASTALCFGMHCVGSAVLAAKATPDHCRRYLEPICRGSHLTTLALSEPGSGSHLYFPQTRTERVAEDTFLVSGSKTFVTNGGYADSYVVSTVAADPGRPIGEFSCVVIRGDAEGIVWGPPWRGMGMRGNASRTMELQDVRVPKTDLLGEEGDQIWDIFHVVAPYFLAAMAGTYLGLAARALDEARNHLRSRTYGHSGKKLGHLPLLQHRLGALWAVVERTRRLAYYAGTAADTGDPNALIALFSAKSEAAECAVEVVNEAMTLMGGIAYREHGTMGRLLRDARAAHVMAPTTDMLRAWTGRALLDLPILGD